MYNWPLDAVHCDIHSVRYDMLIECCVKPSQIGPHQVTYEAAACVCVCNLASGHYTSFPMNELMSSRAVFVQPLGACCYRNK
eukprot:scaffold10564_cov149-Skeletonema_marinoi.AAC.2